MTSVPHIPVMPKEVVEILNPSHRKVFLDATLGSGGHTKLLLQHGAMVIGVDRDEDILDYARQNLKEYKSNIEMHKGTFSQIKEFVGDRKLNGVLFDLGLSSLQLDTPDRGFSFRYNAPLDMRMDKSLQVTAKDLINGLGRKELYDLFKKFAEEQHYKRIADAILESRRVKPIETTKQLADIISKLKPKTGKIHPATKVFQALRIVVNDELNELKAALPSALSLLKPNGVVVVISFHSLEDRIVKNIFKEHEGHNFKIITPKPITPAPAEIQTNPRSRSAKLRAIRKENK